MKAHPIDYGVSINLFFVFAPPPHRCVLSVTCRGRSVVTFLKLVSGIGLRIEIYPTFACGRDALFFECFSCLSGQLACACIPYGGAAHSSALSSRHAV